MSRDFRRLVPGFPRDPVNPVFRITVALAVVVGLAWSSPTARCAPPAAGGHLIQDRADPQIEPERAQFRALILSNPNHFGNVPDSSFKPVVTSFKSNTTYEELGCVGYQPQFKRLEAVVYVKKPFGYGGGLCSAGSTEFVRFYADWNNDNDFNDADEDMGLTSFTAHDIPGEQRLEYAVSLQIDPKRVTFCFTQNLPKVRAILSWNAPPPPSTPGFIPVWGNVEDAQIQIQPRTLIIFDDLFKEIKAKPPEHFEDLVDLKKPVPVAPHKVLDLSELQSLYRGKDVPAHRFAFSHAQKLLEQPAFTEKLLAPGSKGLLPGLEINWSDLFGQIVKTNGDTRFEELQCIGLDPNMDSLVGVLTVKLPNGYSGGLCQAGSTEYVAFWIDYGSGLTFAGTTSVTVHDLTSIPAGGVQYAVFLPVDLDGHRQPCESGPRTAKVRAILSWQAPPTNPDYVPTWGNRLETTIQIAPGPVVQPGKQVPILSSVGDIPVNHIDSNGLATGTGSFTGFVAVDSPFGGMINLSGKIVNGTSTSKYRVMRKPHGAPDSAYVPLTDEPDGLRFTLVTFNGGLTIDPGYTIHADANGYYTYQDYASTHFIEGNILMHWYSARWRTERPTISGLT